MNWEILQFVSVMLNSANNIVDKRFSKTTNAPIICYLASFAVVAFPITLFGSMVVPIINMQLFISSIISGSLFLIAVAFYYQAMTLEEASRVVPILQMSQVIKLIFYALFLGERLEYDNYIAFGLMMVGTFLLGSQDTDDRKFQVSHGVMYMALAAIFLALSSVLSVEVILKTNFWYLLVWSNLGRVLSFIGFLMAPSQQQNLQAAFKTLPRYFWVFLLIEQLVRFASDILSGFALIASNSASLIAIIESSRSLMTVIMAIFILGEPIFVKGGERKITGIFIILCGTLLLTLL